MIHATAIGNLGADAEQRVTQGGKSVLNFRVAAKGRDKSAETTWVRCALWGARGEKVSAYLKKGGRVAVSGTLTASEYNGKAQLDLDVAELELLGDKRPDDVAPRQTGRGAPPARRPSQQADFEDYASDDEIPF